MKLKLNNLLTIFREESVRTMRRYPVELLLTLCSCIGCLVIYELQSFPDWGIRVCLLPLFATLALVVNHLAGQGPWRKLYWVCWAPILPLFLWTGFDEWITSSSGAVTCLVLAPLAVFLCRRAVQNDRFVCDLIVWLRSAVLAVLFANVALGLFCAILYSTTYIFGLDGPWIQDVAVYAVIFIETFVVPMLFLMMSDRWAGAECLGNRVADILINYIITPALLIYTAILYLYMVKILVSWELPRGGVAYLVFGFTIAALSIQALQLILQKRIYNWFFDRFSLIALPTQLLFWIGVMRRVNEYGVTPARVYLLVCGGLMTLCVAIFLSRKLGRYFWVVLSAWVVFALLAFVPMLSVEKIATRSQTHRAERIAARLGMLSENGMLEVGDLSGADSAMCVQLHNLYEALDYIDTRDTVAFARFGLERIYDFSDQLPQSIRDQVLHGWNEYNSRQDESRSNYLSLSSPNGLVSDIKSYRVMYTNFSSWDEEEANYKIENDSLRIWLGKDRPTLKISNRDIILTQLEKIGVKNDYPELDLLREHPDEMLNYVDGDAMIVFYSMDLVRRDSLLWISDVNVSAVLMR